VTVERKQHELDEEVAGFEAELAEVFGVHYERMLRSMHLLVAAALDLDNFVLDDPAARRILLESGARAVDVNETTQRAIAKALADGQMAGETTPQLADRIRHLFEVTWRGRAEMVARTEIQQAQLLASYDRYRASGIVQRVMIHDGGTGDSDAFCNARNGRVVPLSLPVSLAHPNCTLSLSPIVAERVATVEQPTLGQPAPPPEPAIPTLQTSEAFARERLGAQQVNYRKTSPEVAHLINKTFDRLMESKDRGRILFIGPLDDAKRFIGARVRRNPTAIFEVLGSGERIAFGYNPKFAAKLADIEQYAARLRAAGVMRDVSGAEDMLVHEFGHAANIVRQQGMFVDPASRLYNAYLDAKHAKDSDPVSFDRRIREEAGDYVLKNTGEMFGEVYRLWKGGKLPLSLAWARSVMESL
jgi:hypothetical protein